MTAPPDPFAQATGRTDTWPPGAVGLDRSFDARGLHDMREALSAHAGRLAVGKQHLEHLLIVASELANNAVRHGGGTGRLRLWRDGDCVYCQVSDHGPGVTGGSLGTTPPDPGQVGGRGLWIVRQLSESVDILSLPGGAVVTAVLLAPPTDAPARPPTAAPRQIP